MNQRLCGRHKRRPVRDASCRQRGHSFGLRPFAGRQGTVRANSDATSLSDSSCKLLLMFRLDLLAQPTPLNFSDSTDDQLGLQYIGPQNNKQLYLTELMLPLALVPGGTAEHMNLNYGHMADLDCQAITPNHAQGTAEARSNSANPCSTSAARF